MAKWWVVDTVAEELTFYAPDDATKNATTINSSRAEWIEVPAGVLPSDCKVVNTAGVFSLVEDTALKSGPLWAELRRERDQKLNDSDWTQMSDSPLSAGDKTSWATYRQDLRDLPTNTSDPDNVTWPTEP